MAGTMTKAEGGYDGFTDVTSHDCLADDSDGSFPANLETAQIKGDLERMVITFGETTPTAGAVDIVVNDKHGVPVFLASQLTNIAVTAPIEVVPHYALVEAYGSKRFVGSLYVTITGNEVNSAQMSLHFYTQMEKT